MRLQRYLATCGIGSRKKCEEYIKQGRVKIDGKVIKELGIKIEPEKNIILFDNNAVKPEEKIWLILNKPPMYICSSNDPENRSSYLDLIPQDLGRFQTVDRLDYMSEGLLLITNDGELSYKITHPKYGIKKTYEVETLKELTNKKISLLRKGIRSNNELLKIIDIKQQFNSKNPCYTITLGGGTFKHIRRMMEEINIPIKSLKRISIGPIEIGNLKKGQYRELNKEEISNLKNLMESK
jgi:23S rRNA pseudouridine2605 synthase